MADAEKLWGRFVIAGGIDWATLGRKDKSGKASSSTQRPNLDGPHVLRSVATIRFTAIYSGHSACHAVLVDVDGHAWLFGRNEKGQLGTGSTDVIDDPTPLSDTTVFAKVPDALRSASIVHAAVGRSHTLLVTDQGELWASGSDLMGQLGDGQTGKDVLHWQRVKGPLASEKVVKASAGLTFSLALTESGALYAFGSAEKGQLGNGRAGEHVANNKIIFATSPLPVRVKNLDEMKIVDIASGQQHSLALDERGFVYAWGFAGLGRLGFGNQLLPQFASDREILRARQIACGPSASSVIDRNGMYYLFGKFKTSGDGSSGTPWMTPKVVPDMQSLKIKRMSHGGVTLFALSQDEMSIAWGQNAAYGELAAGPDEPKSATKPQIIETLNGIEVLDIVGGQNSTFFLVRPPIDGQGGGDGDGHGQGTSKTTEDAWSALPRFPPEVESPDICVVCNEDKAENAPLECERCERPYHLACLDPPLESVPAGEWFCAPCRDGEMQLPTRIAGAVDDEAEAEPEPESKKRPAPKGGKTGGAKKKKR